MYITTEERVKERLVEIFREKWYVKHTLSKPTTK